MKRDIFNELKKWSVSQARVPLIIKGARQVGKSWVVREFGKSFKYFIELNFEKHKEFKIAFQGTINIKKLLDQLTLYTGVPIHPEETLIFFDEIQECPEAITYLRYFKEEYPLLHVIAAGSLIEFTLEQVGMPVGRVEYLYLTPLSFGEFLTAHERDDLRKNALNKENDVIVDQLLKDFLRTYMWLGGMPEVVSAWLKHGNVETCLAIQDRILTAYQDDFSKYAKKQQIPYVEKVFNHIPQLFGKKFVFTHVDSELRSIVLKNALMLLEKAGISHLCYYSSAQKPPLAASVNEKFFKVFFLDIGLAQRFLKLNYQQWILDPIQVENLGGLAEQFVAQELVAYQSLRVKSGLFYWLREEKNSKAEIDFLVANQHIIPVEVKAGKTGRLKSIHLYLSTHPDAAYGVNIAAQGYGRHGALLQLPLYGIEPWVRNELG